MIQISYSLLFGSSTEQLGDSRRGKEAFIDCDLSLSVTATSTARAIERGGEFGVSSSSECSSSGVFAGSMLAIIKHDSHAARAATTSNNKR